MRPPESTKRTIGPGHRPIVALRPQHPAGMGYATMRTLLLIVGMLLILVTPLVAVLPGPAGMFTFAAGMALILRNSRRARVRFARAMRRHPRVRALSDRALRRPSAKRRRMRADGLAVGR
jgi:hypothetical protein